MNEWRVTTTSGPPSLLLTVAEAARELRIARSHAYALAKSGQLPVVHMGKSVRIPRQALEDWVLQQVQNADREATR